MIYFEYFTGQQAPDGGMLTLVPRPKEWTRDELVTIMNTLINPETEGGPFISRPGKHLANERKGEPETMEDGYYLINIETGRFMAWMTVGAHELLASEKTTIIHG